MGEIDRRYFDGLMADKKLSLRGLAKQMGLNHSQLSLMLSGLRRPQIDEAAQIAQIFGEPLYKVISALGVDLPSSNGRRVTVVGSVSGEGVVTASETIERTTAPADLPDDVIALQFRTAGTSAEWTDGWVAFCRNPKGVDAGLVGRWCYAKIKDGPAIVAAVKRGYKENTFTLSGHFHKESVALEWATPILLTRN